MTNQQKQCATVQHTNAIRFFNQIINSVIDFNKSVKVPINDIARSLQTNNFFSNAGSHSKTDIGIGIIPHIAD